MASIKISGLTEQTTASDTDLLPVASSAGMAKRMTLANFVTWLASKLNSKFAPAGYGLGVSSLGTPFIDTVEKLDSLSENRWFIFTGGVSNALVISGSTITYAYGRVDTYNGNNVMMTLHIYEPYDLRACKCELVRYKVEGAWSEWEWVNPPMIPGIEYRTTERWQGKSVYTKLIDFGALPDTSTRIVSHGITGITQVIRCVGQDITAGDSLPMKYDSVSVGVYASLYEIIINTTSNKSTNTANVQMWYIKG